MNLKENFSLKPYNTFGVEASAAFFARATSVEEIREALNFANARDLPLLILGGGSNVLLTQNWEGLALQVDLKGMSEEIISENEVLVTAQAGNNWHEFVQFCLAKNYGGLENLSLIPGNVGTSPMQNIGAYGAEIKDTFLSCKVLNRETRQTETFDREKCDFGYRESIFKKEGKGKYIILEVTFRLSRINHSLKTGYGAIKTELARLGVTQPTIRDVAGAVINIRKSKLPDPAVLGNAGSFFKNPSVPEVKFKELQSAFPEMPHFPAGDLVKIPAAWLIEQCGWKGKQIGNVASHHLQALVIINATGEATGREIFGFSTMIIESVREKFGIAMEREVNVI